jgi:hypothetical protein
VMIKHFPCKILSRSREKMSSWVAKTSGRTSRSSIMTFSRRVGSISRRDRYWYTSRRPRRPRTSGWTVRGKVPTQTRHWPMERHQDRCISFRPFVTANNCGTNGPSGVVRSCRTTHLDVQRNAEEQTWFSQ